MRYRAFLPLVFALPACGPAAAPSPVAGAAPAVAKAAASAAPSPSARAVGVAPAPAASAAPAPQSACALERGFHGTIGPKLEVFARLERDGGTVWGRYFYAHVGVDIPLAGSVTDAGELALVEGDPARPTGEFAGTCRADGHLIGTWTSPRGASLPFDLASVGARDVLLVATKKRARRFPPRPNPDGPSDGIGIPFEPGEACSEELAWPEIFGAATATSEAALNRALESGTWVFGPGDEASLRACKAGERMAASRTFEISLNEKGLLAVRSHDAMRYEGGTHPWDPGPERWQVLDAHTGAPVTQLLDRSAASKKALRPLLERCLASFADGDATVLELLRERVSLDNPDLLLLPTPGGLKLAATGYPPPLRVLEGDGPILTWAALAAAGAVGSRSPLARLWEGRSAAAAADPCAKQGSP
ncbi:hypothetical protein [Sorangium sp. So ce117]|uniref:hypothetical protein n=1 Tax=Sorangium sp. So ce117 TaxID=3133277 RepID=UPI003F5E1E8F